MTDVVLHDSGLLLHVTPEQTSPRGVACPETVQVKTASGRRVGTYLDFATHQVAIHWRTSAGDSIYPPTLDDLIDRCSPSTNRPRTGCTRPGSRPRSTSTP